MSNEKKLTVDQAVSMIKNNESIDGFTVNIEDQKIESLDAMKLRKNGIHVPDHLVYYDDDQIVYDEDHDQQEWIKVDGHVMSSSDEILALLRTPKEVQDWIRSENIDAVALLNDFVVDLYKNIGRVKYS